MKDTLDLWVNQILLFLEIFNHFRPSTISFTSKLHGFINAQDYYSKNSSIIFVEKITSSTLIIYTANDPFLAKECYPIELLANHAFVQLLAPLQDGQCGFWQKGCQSTLWSELVAVDFFEK